MSFKDFINDYLSFTRKERIGVLCLIFLLLLVTYLPKIAQNKSTKVDTKIDTSWMTLAENLKITTDEENLFHHYDLSTNKSKINSINNLFFFDPNTISNDEWEKLNLRKSTIKTIKNYLNKGGHFYKPEDLKKIYGLRENEFERLLPFIKIESKNNLENHNKISTEKIETKIYTTPKYIPIDINIADTTAFINLPGIGNKLAARIISFREKLGGFYSIEQIREVYALPDSTFQKIKTLLKLETETIKKININTVTADELKLHPYIRWSLANAIIAFRNQHGAFQNLEDLKKIIPIPDEVYIKISPYLMVK